MNRVKIKGDHEAESNIAQERKCLHASLSMQTSRVPFYTSLSTCTVGFDCLTVNVVCSGFPLGVYACTAVAFHTYGEYSCLCLPYICMAQWVYTCKYIQYLPGHVCVRCECLCVY